VKVSDFGIKQMRTKWGTCNIEAKRIWLNLELAKKPLHCLEYIIVHEMVHLLERRHNDRFMAYLDKYMPQWKAYREELNRLPVRHVGWGVLRLNCKFPRKSLAHCQPLPCSSADHRSKLTTYPLCISPQKADRLFHFILSEPV
jgi:hypothetical protein